MNEIIYILINESMPGYVKIGKTNNSVKERMSQLDRTNIPLPFECYYACEVENAHEEEKWLHSIFSDRRVRDGREFFKIDPERVVAAIRRIQKRDVTPKDFLDVTKEEQGELEEAKSIRARFDFARYGISTNAMIMYVRDNSIQAKVLENNKIEIDNEITSLSASAQKLLGYKKGVAGTLYWMYEGETLDERRRRIESGE
ncbi:MAG: GIY-YIG nuclease family protein [bacterium]|nr:GIY-YIG nuclease family protein [bacterium]